jgi:transposase-like protein
VSKDTISRITEKVGTEMSEWQHRPLDGAYPVTFIDALMVKVRDGQVTNRPFYVVIGVTTTAGERDILGIWAGDGGEGAKYWLNVLTETKNRGEVDVCIAVCDGLKGLPEAITTVWQQGLRRRERGARAAGRFCRRRAEPLASAETKASHPRWP